MGSVDILNVRIVVATPSLPLPFGTADARWLHVVVTELARRGHHVVCLSCTEEGPERIAAAGASADHHGFQLRHVPMRLSEHPVRRKLHSFRRPFSEYVRVPELVRALDEEAGAADVVHIEHLFPGWLGLDRDDAVTYLHHLEVIDWEHRTDLSRRERTTRMQMERATQHLLCRLPRIIGATSRLTDRVGDYQPGVAAEVVPVSIDPSCYEVLPLPDRPVVGVIGSMHWYPSRSAAERVLTRLWPQIHRAVPEARLVVAGWGSEVALGHLFPLPGAELLGAVERPEDFFGWINTLLYPPARGSGFKIKVLESMAYGRAVVSNSEGLEGLTDRPNPIGPPLDEDHALIDRTIELLHDGAERARLGAAGRQLVDEVYSPRPAIDRLEAAYQHLGVGARVGR